MGTCYCQRCREARDRELDRLSKGDMFGAVAIVLIFIVLLVFLPLGAW